VTAYYNEHDPHAAAWLRALIDAGHIAPGIVDERSIEDVYPSDLRGFTQCHFFAGIGVWSYALRQSGWGDDRPVWTGSCPCQPFSSAGKGTAFDDERHLWPHFHHLIRQCRPGVVFGEQVASKNGLAWLDLVQPDLEAEDYAFAAVDLCAAGVGAPHIRQRLFWVGYANKAGLQGYGRPKQQHDAAGRQGAERHGAEAGFWSNPDWIECRDGKRRPVEPGTFPLVDGTPARVVRLCGYGNAINAEAAKAFISAFMEAA
jgi:DNA (cytosine-5)-methyltransferase 1